MRPSVHQLADFAVLGAALGIIVADVAHQRSIGHGIDHGIALAGVDVAPPQKIRHHKNIIARPVKPLAADLGRTAALDHDTKRASGFALELGLLAGTKELRGIVQCCEHRLAGDRVNEVDLYAFVGIAFFIAQRMQRIEDIGAAIMNERRGAAAHPDGDDLQKRKDAAAAIELA